MKKKTFFTLIAACIFTMTLSSCFFDEGWYDYPYHGYGSYHHGPSWRSGYHSHGGRHHGPNAQIDEDTQAFSNAETANKSK